LISQKFIVNAVVQAMEYELTDSQTEAVEKLSHFILNPDLDQCFILKGYAGTGKTTLVASLVRVFSSIGAKVILLAPTGRAAKVLSGYANYPAYTIHKWIYRQKSMKDGIGRFSLDRNLAKNAFYIVDEASMLSNSEEDSAFGSGQLLTDLIEYVRSGENCKMILVGDDAQLPPVKQMHSPALNPRELLYLGYIASESQLIDVVRQSEESGILFNAIILRDLIKLARNILPNFQTEGYSDIVRINGSEVPEAIEQCYNRDGVEETVVISYSNKRANIYNSGIRNQILWHESEIANGDLLMVARNNYFWSEGFDGLPFIANGDMLELLKIYGFKELYGLRFARAQVRMVDYEQQEFEATLLLDTLSIDGPSLPTDRQKIFFESVSEDYAHIKTKVGRMSKIKMDPHYNALQVKFAYAITCHKAQGGQWKNVFIYYGYQKPENIGLDYLRWLYTAFTRATQRVYLINFPKEFFL